MNNLWYVRRLLHNADHFHLSLHYRLVFQSFQEILILVLD